MRIIAGEYRGRIIKTVNDLSVRPATDRVRQTLFDMLTNRILFDGIRVLDLFAGSGSLGLEALSRGAAHVTFVESGPEAIRYLEENIRSLGLEAATEIVPLDALAFARGGHGSFSVVFADPPYAYTGTAELPARLFGAGLIAPGGYLLIEHPARLAFPPDDGLASVAERRFGRTVVTFFQQRSRQ